MRLAQSNKGSGCAPAWTLKEFAASKGCSVHHLAQLAYRTPLPATQSTYPGCNPRPRYLLKDLEAWYPKAATVPPKLSEFTCPDCGAQARSEKGSRHTCHDCRISVLLPSAHRRILPEHGAFDEACDCARCRIRFNGTGTVRVNPRFLETPFLMQIDTRKQEAFYVAFRDFSFDLQFIATEVFRGKETLTVDMWAKRVRLFGLQVQGKRGKFIAGPITQGGVEALACLIEALDD